MSDAKYRCKIKGCKNPGTNGIYCTTHYNSLRMKLYSTKGCSKRVKKGGFCWDHMARCVVEGCEKPGIMPVIVAICTVKAEEFVLQEMHNPCNDLHFALINVVL